MMTGPAPLPSHLRPSPRFRPLIMLGYWVALLGRIEAARASLQEAASRSKGEATSLSVLPEALVACREGQPARALEVLATRWREVEIAGASITKFARIVRAFALNAIDPVGNRDATHETLAGAKPIAPGELQPLIASWPEMEAFLVDQRLTPLPASPTAAANGAGAGSG